MAKLQLYIAKSLRGYKSLVNFNPDEDVRSIIADYRQSLSTIAYNATKINIFYLVSYCEQGVLISVIRTIPEQQGDHLSAGILVPVGMKISADELMQALEEVRVRVCEPSMDAAAVASLRTFFSKDYQIESGKTPARVISAGRKYAAATYGGQFPKLEDYAANTFYLPAFALYAGVLLVSEGTQITGVNASVKSLPHLIVLNPPASSPEGFVPHIYGQELNRTYLIAEGEPIQVTWQKNGFDSINQTIKPVPDFEIPLPESADAVKTISAASFCITPQGGGAPLSDCTIRVNGKDVSSPVSFKYRELKPARVEVSAPGYCSFVGHMNLAATTQALVRLKEQRKVYRFELPVSTPEPTDNISFTIESRLNLTECPVEGYSISGGEAPAEGETRTNTLAYGGTRKQVSFLPAIIAAVLGILLGVFLGWCMFGGNEEAEQVIAITEDEISNVEVPAYTETIVAASTVTTDTIAPIEDSTATENSDSVQVSVDTLTSVQTETQAEVAEVVAEQVTDYTAAKQYLDNHRVWKADEMAAVPGLNGLFEAMNTYDFDAIRNVWAPRLEGSTNFAKVLAAVNGSASKPNPRRGNHNPTYNREGDNAINWRGYTFWVDP